MSTQGEIWYLLLVLHEMKFRSVGVKSMAFVKTFIQTSSELTRASEPGIIVVKMNRENWVNEV